MSCVDMFFIFLFAGKNVLAFDLYEITQQRDKNYKRKHVFATMNIDDDDDVRTPTILIFYDATLGSHYNYMS